MAGTYAPPAVQDPMTMATCIIPSEDSLDWLKKIRPKSYLSGNTLSCSGRKTPPESTIYTIGIWFSRAISCALICFLMVSSIYVPPFTVASFAMITVSLFCINPIPVMIPAEGNWFLYWSQAAKVDNSKNGVFLSTSRSILSLASNLFLSLCFFTAASDPPRWILSSLSRNSISKD